MAREIIGHMACPECGGAAEVKRTKAGLAYRWCMDCHAQYFPRTAESSDRLVAKCGAGTVSAPAPKPPKAEEPAPEKKPPAAPGRKADTPAPVPAPKPKSSGNPFDFLLNA